MGCRAVSIHSFKSMWQATSSQARSAIAGCTKQPQRMQQRSCSCQWGHDAHPAFCTCIKALSDTCMQCTYALIGEHGTLPAGSSGSAGSASPTGCCPVRRPGPDQPAPPERDPHAKVTPPMMARHRAGQAGPGRPGDASAGCGQMPRRVAPLLTPPQ